MKVLATAREIWGPGHPWSYPGQPPSTAAVSPPLCLPLGREVRLIDDDERRIRQLLAPLGRDGFVSCNHQ